MSSNLIKIIAVFFVALAVILAIVGFRMSHQYAENANRAAELAQAQAQTNTVPQTQVVVATKPLPANQPITSDEVKLVPVQIAPQDYYTSVDDAVGRTPLIDVDTGSPVTPRMFKESNQLAKLVPPGHKAVSLNLTEVIGVGGFVRPGDVVDVLVYLRSDHNNGIEPSQARILLRDALVLGVDERIVAPPAGMQNPNQQPQQTRRERTIVVAVPDEQVTRVMLGANMGDVRLALHGQGADQNQVAATGEAGGPAEAAGPGRAAAPGAAQDQPFTSAELGLLKPVRPPNAGPAIEIYRGSSASTVYP
ncbi:MAG: Flp pilus assembly protein CpaB [Nevskia sp.]|nr:Flp pilus assembly protein CpaB [Nevskia sp.]